MKKKIESSLKGVYLQGVYLEDLNHLITKQVYNTDSSRKSGPDIACYMMELGPFQMRFLRKVSMRLISEQESESCGVTSNK